jgi:hypothetical protein
LVKLRAADWPGASKGLITGEQIAAAFEAAMSLEDFSGPRMSPFRDVTNS